MYGSFVSAGLVAPYAAVALCGSSGAVAILILVFLAVTSAASAELIAVSSLLTFDVYREYVKPNATGQELIHMAHYTTVGFGIFMGVLASVLNNFGITLGYLYLLMGIIVAPAVVPIALTLTWSKQSATAAITAAVVGFCGGLTAWLVTAQCYYGEVSLDSTGGNYPMLAGNLVSLLLPILITVPMSFAAPQNYDFSTTMAIQPVADEREETISEMHKELSPVEEDPHELNKALKIAYAAAWLLTAVLIFIIPLPMLGQKYVFSYQFFTGWVVVGFTWTWMAGLFVSLFPIYESKDGIMSVISGIIAEVFSGKQPDGGYAKASEVSCKVSNDVSGKMSVNDASTHSTQPLV
jgi:Na+/proline symporter